MKWTDEYTISYTLKLRRGLKVCKSILEHYSYITLNSEEDWKGKINKLTELVDNLNSEEDWKSDTLVGTPICYFYLKLRRGLKVILNSTII